MSAASWINGDDGYLYRDMSVLNGWMIVKIKELETGDYCYSAYKDGDQLSDMGYYDSMRQIKRIIRGVEA